MGELFVRSGIILLIVLAWPTLAAADAHLSAKEQDLPSAAMLEFLGELEPIDEDTWQLLEHHALQDVAQNKEVNSE
jgi:hypothetical protein